MFLHIYYLPQYFSVNALHLRFNLRQEEGRSLTFYVEMLLIGFMKKKPAQLRRKFVLGRIFRKRRVFACIDEKRKKTRISVGVRLYTPLVGDAAMAAYVVRVSGVVRGQKAGENDVCEATMIFLSLVGWFHKVCEGRKLAHNVV